MRRPRLGIIPGDPSGIGPELIAKLLQEPAVLAQADVLLIGDAHLWEGGAKQAGLPLHLKTIDEANLSTGFALAHLDLATIAAEDVQIATVTQASGNSALRCLDKALDLAQSNTIDGILFAPFNKAALTLAGLNAEDEHRYMARYLGFEGYHSEINVLDALMTTRVTSHIGLKDVAANIDQPAVMRAVDLAYSTLKSLEKQGLMLPWQRLTRMRVITGNLAAKRSIFWRLLSKLVRTAKCMSPDHGPRTLCSSKPSAGKLMRWSPCIMIKDKLRSSSWGLSGA